MYCGANGNQTPPVNLVSNGLHPYPHLWNRRIGEIRLFVSCSLQQRFSTRFWNSGGGDITIVQNSCTVVRLMRCSLAIWQMERQDSATEWQRSAAARSRCKEWSGIVTPRQQPGHPGYLSAVDTGLGRPAQAIAFRHLVRGLENRTATNHDREEKKEVMLRTA